MIEYLKNILPKVKEFSKEIDTLSKLYNQPWVIITEKENFIKLIFQDSDKLIVSINGIVSNGRWELLSTANSILLEFHNQKRLYIVPQGRIWSFRNHQKTRVFRTEK